MQKIAKPSIEAVIRESIEVKKQLLENNIKDIENCGNIIADALDKGGKALLCGNGGSAADSQHIAAELVIRFRGSVNRAAIPAIALTVDPSIMSGGGNDIGFDNIFAREVEAYGRPGDILIGISTSGNSENVLRAIKQSKEHGLTSIGLLGNGGGKISEHCDASVVVPGNVTARIQESHIMIAHIWCEMIEAKLFPDFFEK